MQARRPRLTGPTVGRARPSHAPGCAERGRRRAGRYRADAGASGGSVRDRDRPSGQRPGPTDLPRAQGLRLTRPRPGGASKADAEPRVGESGRWFRPAKAEAGFLAIPPDHQADVPLAGAEPKVTAADASADGGGTTPGRAAAGTAPSSAETDAARPSAAADAEAARGSGRRGHNGGRARRSGLAVWAAGTAAAPASRAAATPGRPGRLTRPAPPGPAPRRNAGTTGQAGTGTAPVWRRRTRAGRRSAGGRSQGG